MVLKKEVTDAFAKLGLDPGVSQEEASRTFKRLALANHPDKNLHDKDATHKFQEVRVFLLHFCEERSR
jgi:DnaJ-class molecular chaperone